MAVRSQQEIYNIFIQEFENQTSKITDVSEGSLTDIFGGAISHAASELSRLIVEEFKKTFFSTAEGPDATGGPDDLNTLAVDHFGTAFERPGATKATATVTFSRETDDAGEVTIPEGTELSTPVDANGESIRFVTLEEVSMEADQLEVSAEVEAAVAGLDGRVEAGAISIIDSTLTDSSVTVTNETVAVGGSDAMTDDQYRQYIADLIQTLRGATLRALEAAAASVEGIEYATAIEELMAVIEYNISEAAIEDGAVFFRLPIAVVYVADSDGTSSASMVASAQDALDLVRAAGVRVVARGGSAQAINWTAQITLNPEGPNYDTLSEDTQMIEDSMTNYLATLPVGTSFVRATARTAILAIWGPSGTGDLTDFQNVTPSGNVSLSASQKAVAGTIGIV